MISKTSLRGNATPLPHPLRAVPRTSVAFLTTPITYTPVPVRVPRITHGLETRMEINTRACISRKLKVIPDERIFDFVTRVAVQGI